MSLSQLKDPEVTADGVERFVGGDVGRRRGPWRCRSWLRPALEVTLSQSSQHASMSPCRGPALDTPVPYSPPLEEYFLPSVEEAERAARLLVAY